MLPNFAYSRPATLKEALSQLSGENIRIYAGGTDLLSCLRDDVFTASKVVSLNSIKDMSGVQRTDDGGVKIGALTTLTEIGNNSIIQEEYRCLSQGASEAASPQLRNQGTIGGNICQKPRCWYYRGEFHCLRKGGGMCFAAGGENQFHAVLGSDNKCWIVHPSDTAPNLVALGAKVSIIGPKGKKTVAIDDFFVPPAVNVEKETILEPNEIVTEVILPPSDKRAVSSYRKIRARKSWDFALAGLALNMSIVNGKIDKCRAVLSGAAPVPWRSKEMEDALMGEALNESTIDAAAKSVMKNAEPLQYNEYKIPLFQGMVRDELGKIIKNG